MTTSQIILVLFVGGFASIVKSITGFGYPIVLLPVLALFLDISEAVVIVAPSNLFLNLRLVRSGRAEWSNSSTLPRFLIGGVVGAIGGALLLPRLPNNLLRGALVVIIVVFLVNQLRSAILVLSDHQGLRFAPAVGAVAGLFHGASGISGPIVTPWFLSLGLTRDAFLLSVAAVFSLSGIVQIVVLLLQGLYTRELFLLSMALIPLSLFLFPVGERIGRKISIHMFHRSVLMLLALSAVSLVVRMF